MQPQNQCVLLLVLLLINLVKSNCVTAITELSVVSSIQRWQFTCPLFT